MSGFKETVKQWDIKEGKALPDEEPKKESRVSIVFSRVFRCMYFFGMGALIGFGLHGILKDILGAGFDLDPVFIVLPLGVLFSYLFWDD